MRSHDALASFIPSGDRVEPEAGTFSFPLNSFRLANPFLGFTRLPALSKICLPRHPAAVPNSR